MNSKQRVAKIQRLEAQVKSLQAIINGSSDAIFSVNKKSVIETWNLGAEHVFGYSADLIVGKSFFSFLLPDRGETQHIKKILQSGKEPYLCETVFVHQTGRHVDVSLSIAPMTHPAEKNTRFSCVMRDISDRKAIEKRKDEFISLASHELKTPLTSVKAFTQLLGKYFQQRRFERVFPTIHKLNTVVDRLSLQTEDLLDMTRIQNGTVALHLKAIDLPAQIRTTLSELQHLTTIPLEYRSSVQNLFVSVDPDRIVQVLTNLINNAAKYAPDSPQIIVRLRLYPRSVVVSIQDFGPGIRKSEQSRIFERFYRAKTQKATNWTGTGLGLYISRQIIYQHHGKIWVRSASGKGTTFLFSLPIKRTS